MLYEILGAKIIWLDLGFFLIFLARMANNELTLNFFKDTNTKF